MELLILVLLILLNGVFALSEMAIVSSRKPRLKAMADRGNGGAKTALRLLDDPSKLLSTVQIGITAIGVIAGAYSATALSDDLTPIVASWHTLLAPHAELIAFSVVIVFTTFLSLVQGEEGCRDHGEGEPPLGWLGSVDSRTRGERPSEASDEGRGQEMQQQAGRVNPSRARAG